MTLQELVYSLKKAMLANPLVHTWIDDFNFTSAYHDIKYGAAALDIGLFNVDRKGFMTVNVNLYCFDRMYDEPSDSKMVRTENNSLPLYSKCMMVVQNAIKTMDTRIGIVDATYQPFRHKYTDDCAGVLCQLTLTAPFTICYDDFYEPIPIPDVTLNAIISHGSVAATVNDVPVQLPYTAPRGTQVQLLVNPDDGYSFVEWSDHNTQNPRQVTMTTDLTLACECVVPVVTHVIVATATNGTITGSGVYNEGAPVLLKVTPSQHYHLNEGAWTGLPSSATFNADFTEASFTADADYTILVNCIEDTKYVVTVSCENCSSTSGGEFYEGDLVTLIAEPDLHYHMSATSWNGLPYWAERSADYQTVTFTIDNNNYNVTATGRIDKHTFTVEATNASYVSEGGTYDYGTTQHAMVTPLDGYHCTEGSWTGLPDDAVFNYNYTSVDFTLDQDRTIICNCYPDVPTTRTLTFTAAEYGSVRGWVDGVEVTSPALVTAGQSIRLVATPDEECHFVNWSDGTTTSTYEFTMPDNDVTLEAFFAVNVYLLYLTYDAPEGMPVPTMSGGGTMPAGTERVVSTSAAETGYVFQGWYEESTLISSELSFTYTMPAHAVDLVAHYRALGTYTITASCAHGTITGAGTYAEGATCTLTCTPSAHWNFDRWTEDGVEVSTSSTYSFVVNSDRTLVAEVHEDTKYMITYDCTHGEVTGWGWYYGGQTCTLTYVPNAHYHFDHWADGDYPNPRSFVVTQDAHYIVYGSIDQHTIIVTSEHGTTTGSGTYDWGSEVSIGVDAELHYHFDHWTDGDYPNPRTITVRSDSTYEAVCVEDTKYTLTFSAINGSVDKTSFIGYYGEEVVVEASTNLAHYHWAGWNDGNMENPRTFVATADADYVARFEEDEKFTLQFNGNFCSCSPSSFTGYLNDTVEVDVVDITEHYHWGSWNDGSTAKPRTFTVEGSAIYTATCEIDQHTITTAVTPVGSGSVAGGGTYNWGASVTLTATANEGYQFVKWSDDVTTSTRTITVTGDATYTAEFELSPVTPHNLDFWADDNNGDVTATVDGVSVESGTLVYPGQTVVVTDTPHDGYDFMLWRIGHEPGESYDNPYTFEMPDGIDYATSFHTLHNYTLTFSVQGQGQLAVTIDGESVESPAVFTIDSNVTLFADVSPEHPEYEFKHFIDEDGIIYEDNTYEFTGIEFAKDKTFTAVFEEPTASYNLTYSTVTTTYKVTEVQATYDDLVVTLPALIPAGKEVTLTATASSSSYAPVMWRDNSESGTILSQTTICKITMPSEDHNIFVRCYAPKTITTTIDDATHGRAYATHNGWELTSPAQVYATSSTPCAVDFVCELNDGYLFSQWSDGVTTNPHGVENITANTTISATTRSTILTLTFSATEGGTAFATVNGVEVTSPATVHEGDAVVLQALGEAGYTFTGWTDEGGVIYEELEYSFSMPAQDKTFVARFSPEIVGGYLTFTPVTTEESDPDAPAQATIYLENNGTNNPQCKWSYDGELWQPVPTTSTSALTFQQPIYLKGVNASGFSTSSSNYSIIHLTGLSGSKVEASGSVMSLIDGVGESTAIPGSGFCFTYLFKGCISLLTPPSLPATTLTITCYSQMFHGCTSLTSVPYLPAETLTTRCYSQMFQGCTSLTAAPALPATTLAEYCYSSMFSGCTSLVNPPTLPATTLAQYCYGSMFYGCTSLTSAPSLPATTLAISCYGSMFSGCTSLTSAPSLPATTLAQYCYQGMFIDCTSLTSAPALPATTLTQGCYYSMFYGCTSLVNPPVLPAETIVNYCYYQMFYYCVKLTGPVSILASNNPATLNITGMFTNTGTARPSTPTDYNKIYVGGNVALWNSITAGIDSTYWTVQLITEDADDQLPDEPQSE